MENQKTVAWLQITAGQGPKECAWIVAQVCQKLLQESDDVSIKADIVERLAFDKMLRNQWLFEPDTLLSVLIRLEGDNVSAFTKRWVGTIKWQGESIYRPKHKRKNWFVAVHEVAVATHKTVNNDQISREVTVETMRSQGPGGQHVNKTSSAVRITHIPSGIQVRVDTDRSQHRNKQLAMERLHQLLLSEVNEEAQRKEKDRWLKHYQVSRGNPLRVFAGSKFKEVY